MRRLFIILFFIIGISQIVIAQTPLSPYLKTVSIDPFTSYTEFSWIPSPSPIVDGYIIYRWRRPLYLELDTVGFAWGINTTRWTLQTLNGKFKSETYSIAAVDTVNGGIPGNWKVSESTDSLTTMFLTVNFDTCLTYNQLEWNHFGGWQDSLMGYNIYKRINSGIFQIVGNTPNDISSFNDTEIKPDSSYCYYIEARHQAGRSSTSNMACTKTIMTPPPAYLYAMGTEFIDEQIIKISFNIDPASELNKYYLLRSTQFEGPYDTLKYLEYSPDGPLEIRDTLPEKGTWYYRLAALNNCLNVVRLSNVASLLNLNTVNLNFLNSLSWNAYKDWAGGVSNYFVYRQTGQGTPTLIATPGPTDTTYTDDTESLIDQVGKGDFCYYVEAREGDGNPFGFQGYSKSNKSCVQPKILLYMPNAFTPNGDGKNDRFLPFLTFIPVDYLFIIRNRLGNILFQTTDYQSAWDGLYRGRKTTEGVYIYYVKAKAPDGSTVQKMGRVTVLYPDK